MLAASRAFFAQWLPELPCASLWKACAKHMTTIACCCALSACAWKRRFSNCSTPAPRNSTHKEQHRTFPKPREHASTTRAAHQLHTPLDNLPPLSTTPASHRHATSNTPSRQLANLAKRGVSSSWLAESMAKPLFCLRRLQKTIQNMRFGGHRLQKMLRSALPGQRASSTRIPCARAGSQRNSMFPQPTFAEHCISRCFLR